MSRKGKAPASGSSFSSPPIDYLCPISNSLMADPVLLTSYSFERAIVETCKEFNCVPIIIPSASRDEFLTYPCITNPPLRNSILKWCEKNGQPRPIPISKAAACGIIERSLSEGQVVDAHPLVPEIFTKLMDPDASIQVSGIIALLKTILGSRDSVVLLCTSRIVLRLIPFLTSSHHRIQTGSLDVILQLCKIPSNTTKMVQWGIVPPLLDVLKTGLQPARAKAVEIIQFLAMDTKNRADIGAIRAIPVLLEIFFLNPQQELRKESGNVLYDLSLCLENVKILKNMRVVPKLLEVAIDKSSNEANLLQSIAMALMGRLAKMRKGAEEIVDFGVVEAMLRIMREGEELDGCCLDLLQTICNNCSDRFRMIAMAAGAEKVVPMDKEEWREVGRKKVREILEKIPQDSYSIKLRCFAEMGIRNAGMRTTLCNESLDEVIPMLLHSSDEIQVNATLVIYTFASESSNRIKIAKSEAVPNLVHVLNKGVLKVRSYAAAAFYYLALGRKEIIMAMVSSEAIKALLEIFSDPRINPLGRKYAGAAVYVLTSWPETLELRENIGAALLLRQVAAKELRDDETDFTNPREGAMALMYNLAERSNGREELINTGIVEETLRMMREGKGFDKFCLALMRKICTNCSDQFRGVAMAAGAEDVLAMEKEGWGEDGRKKAREILGIILQKEVNHEEARDTSAAELSQSGISDTADEQSSQ